MTDTTAPDVLAIAAALADRIVQALKTHAPASAPAVPFDKVLWDATQCAEYFQVPRQTFVDDLSKAPGFPAPFCNVGKGQKKPRYRWRAAEVVKFRQI